MSSSSSDTSWVDVLDQNQDDDFSFLGDEDFEQVLPADASSSTAIKEDVQERTVVKTTRNSERKDADIYFDLRDHPGTKDWKNYIRKAVQRYPGSAYSPKMRDWVLHKCHDRQFWIKQNDTWQIATPKQVEKRIKQRIKDTLKPLSPELWKPRQDRNVVLLLEDLVHGKRPGSVDAKDAFKEYKALWFSELQRIPWSAVLKEELKTLSRQPNPPASSPLLVERLSRIEAKTHLLFRMEEAEPHIHNLLSSLATNSNGAGSVWNSKEAVLGRLQELLDECNARSREGGVLLETLRAQEELRVLQVLWEAWNQTVPNSARGLAVATPEAKKKLAKQMNLAAGHLMDFIETLMNRRRSTNIGSTVPECSAGSNEVDDGTTVHASNPPCDEICSKCGRRRRSRKSDSTRNEASSSSHCSKCGLRKRSTRDGTPRAKEASSEGTTTAKGDVSGEPDQKAAISGKASAVFQGPVYGKARGTDEDNTQL